MPKPTKAQRKAALKAKQQKQKGRNEPQTPSFTTKKSYWITLTLMLAVVIAVLAFMLNFSLINNALLVITIVCLMGFIAYLRLSSSTLSWSKRATFLFVGASVIGFGIWGAIAIILNATGITMQLSNIIGDDFFVIPSLIIGLIAGAFIGELLGRNSKVQAFFFKNQ